MRMAKFYGSLKLETTPRTKTTLCVSMEHRLNFTGATKAGIIHESEASSEESVWCGWEEGRFPENVRKRFL